MAWANRRAIAADPHPLSGPQAVNLPCSHFLKCGQVVLPPDRKIQCLHELACPDFKKCEQGAERRGAAIGGDKPLNE